MENDTVQDQLEDNQESSVVEQILADVEKRIDADQYDEAMEILHYALRRPEFDIRVYEKAAFVLRMAGKHQAAELFEAILANREDAEPYFRLGYQFVQEGAFASALGPLSRCVQLAPDAPAANYEFAYALMKEFYNEEALHFFVQAFQQDQALSITFYIAQMLIFLERLEEAGAFVQRLEEQVKEAGEGEMQLDYIKGMFRRYSEHKPQNIRDWHFVQYGTLLLRLFEEDHPNEPNDSNGRYTVVNFSFEQVALVLNAFQSVVGTNDVFPKYDYIAAAGKASEPLAHAFGKLVRLPVKSLAEGLAAGEKGIVIASFSDELVEIAADVWEGDDILLFSFAVSWTREINILPEVIGYLAQAGRLPWQERLEFEDNGQPVLIQEDDRPAEDIARDILDRISDSETNWIAFIENYYKERKNEIIAGKQADVPRKRFFVHSALGGARYQ